MISKEKFDNNYYFSKVVIFLYSTSNFEPNENKFPKLLPKLIYIRHYNCQYIINNGKNRKHNMDYLLQ